MPVETIVLGPVLSFRGLRDLDGVDQWCVTALVGVKGNLPPALQLEGRAGAVPITLLTHDGVEYVRFDLTVPLATDERTVEYGFPELGTSWRFTVPSIRLAPRFAYVSCNGFSDPARMRKLQTQAGAVWTDLICNHDARMRLAAHPSGYLLDKEQLWHEARVHAHGLQRFHVLLMGGDQIYFDSIWEASPDLKRWAKLSRKDQLVFKPTAKLKAWIESYYVTLYRERWFGRASSRWKASARPLDSADAMASIPTIMMWDDHDIFDGWGSYSPELQHSELFRWMFRCARRAFWVMQMQHPIELLPELSLGVPVEHVDDPQYTPITWSNRLRSDPRALPLLDDQPGFSSAFAVGPVALLVADLRTERSQRQIMSEATWRAWQRWAWELRGIVDLEPGEAAVEHMLILSSVPVAHPKLSLAETLLDTFGSDDVLKGSADDLRDHWTHDDHEGERKRLLQSLCAIADSKKIRVAIVSGDVHVAAWGIVHRIGRDANRTDVHQFTSSAVVHPSLAGMFERAFLGVLNSAGDKPQPIDVEREVRMMLFPGYGKYVMPARNWLALEVERGQSKSGMTKLWATWRCETDVRFSNHLYALHPAT